MEVDGVKTEEANAVMQVRSTSDLCLRLGWLTFLHECFCLQRFPVLLETFAIDKRERKISLGRVWGR